MKNAAMKILVALSATLFAWSGQAQSPKAFENAANDAFRSKDYYSAMQYYGKVLEMEPTRLDLSYRYADAARQSGAFGQAEAWFEKTIQSDQLREFPDAELRLASVKKSLGKYDEAIKLFEKHEISPKGTETSPLRKQAQADALQCEWAMEKTMHPDRSIEIKQLSDLFNTPQPDFGTAIFDGKIYYSSFRDTKWGDRHYPTRPISKIMEVSAEGGDPTPAPFNVDKRHTAHAAFSPDANFVVFNQCDYVGDIDVVCELYFSEKTSTGWSKPVALPENINVEGFTSTQPSVAATGDGYYWLYYVSSQPGGKGGLDLWRVQCSATGTFGKPQNLRDLNTPENDITPSFDAKHNLLYFSTRGQWTLGGYDIYKVALKDGKWQTPEHLDAPYNSSFDDVYFVPTSEEFAYLTSNRSGSRRLDEICCYDIFKVEYLPLSLQALAFSKIGYRPLDNVVFSLEEMTAEGEKPTIVTHFSGDENSTGFDIMRQRTYRIIATKEFYRPDTLYVTTNTFPPDRVFVEKLFLVPELNLAVKTFHQWTKEPLADVHIRLIEIGGKQFGNKSTGKENNEAKLDVSDRRWFTIIAEKKDFAPDTVTVAAEELRALVAGETLTKNLFLSPASMSTYLPIALFFDNDQPDPRTYSTTTKLSYEQTVDRYTARRAAFIESYTANLQGIEKERAAARLGKFFDEDVVGGQAKLEDFAGNLSLFLNSGASLNIMVKAFASPLAKPEYNMALTQRRIASVRHYFRRYENGIFER
ncbi:MAG: tetratricopeptide repeat protein, partial [Saprospiraceae bacterium]